jgi:hypothetical protein
LQPDLIYTDSDLNELGDRCRTYAQDIKRYLGFTVPSNATNIWIFRQLCSQLGIKTSSQRQRQDGEWVRRCQLDAIEWQNLQHVLASTARVARPGQTEFAAIADHPLLISFINQPLITPPLASGTR